MEISNEYISDLQFIGNSVKSIEIENPFVCFPEESEKIFQISYKQGSIEERENRKQGIIALDVTVELKQDNHVFKLHLVNEGCFSISKEVTNDDFSTLLSLNGCATLYSISRSYILTITANTFAKGSVVLPMLNFVKARDGQKKKE